MPTFRKQIRVKCEFSFVEWANQPGIRTSKRVKGQGWKPTLLDPKLYWKIFGGTISQFHKAFLFLILVIRVYFAFLGSKVTELLWWSLFPVCMAHGTHHISDELIYSKFALYFFDRKTPYYWQNVRFFIINFCLLDMHICSKIVLIAKQVPIESDQHHVPVQRSRAINSLSVVT